MRLRAAITCAAFLLASLATAQNANHWENLFTASDALDGSETLILQLTTGTCLSGPTPVPSTCQRFVSPQDIADFVGASDTFLAIEVDGTPVSTLAPTINFQGVDFVLVESPADTFALSINSGIARDTELHVAVVLAGTPNYIVASGTDNQTLTLTQIDLATDVTGSLPLAGDVSGAHSANQVDSVQPNSVALSTDTTGNYAAGDAEAGNATSLAADALDAMAEIAAGIKRGPDATDTHLLTTDVAAPGSPDCLEMDTDGSVILTGGPCVGGGAFDDSGDPVVLNTTTKEVEIGPALAGAAKLTVRGDADEVQFLLRGNATQTNRLLLFEQDDGTDVFQVNNSGGVQAADGLTILGGSTGTLRLVANVGNCSGNNPYSFLSDTDTGYSRFGANVLCMVTGGAEQFRLNVTGNHLVNSLMDEATTAEAGWTHTCTINKATSGSDTCAVFNRVATAAPGPSLIAAFRLENVDQLTINDVGTVRGLDAGSAFSVSAGDDAAGNLGALTSFKSATATINSSAGPTLTASNLIPAGSFLMGLTIRITTGLGTTTGLTDFDVGDGSDVDRWANSLAIIAGTTMDLTDATANASGDFPAANDVVLTAVGGNFDGTGTVEILAHIIQLTPPTG